jgi:hypothetical protein
LRVAVGALVILVFGSVAATSGAQVPPLPPETQPALEGISPVVAPACGNAILGATILAGTAPPEAREALELATANVFVLCGSIPIPPSAPTHCVDDDVLATVLTQVGGATIGGALPVAPPGAGQVVDAIRILQDRFPVPADDEGLVASLAAALDCRFASVSAPTPGRTPTAEIGDTPAAPVTGGSPVLVPIGTGPPIPVSALGVTDAVRNVAVAPVVPSSASGRGRPVSHPLWIVPVLLVVVGLAIGRGLLAREPN